MINPRIDSQRPSAGALLSWLEAHAVEILIQAIPRGHRPKNRCVVQFRDQAGGIRAVGGASIAGAVRRAQLRMEAVPANIPEREKAALGGRKGAKR